MTLITLATLKRLPWYRIGKVSMFLALLVCLPWAVWRAVNNGGCDFEDYRRAGQYVLDHHHRNEDSMMFRYLPSTDVAMIPLALLPPTIGATLWYLFNCACWYGFLRTVRGMMPENWQTWLSDSAVLAAAWLILPLAIDGFLVATFHLAMLWLMVAGLHQVAQNREITGGVLLGTAVWVKLLPVAGVGYLLLKRKWKPAFLALLVTLAIDLVLCLPAYGVRGTVEVHRHWIAHGALGATKGQMGEEVVNEDRLTNQSLNVALRRILTDNSPHNHLAVTDLSPRQLLIVFLTLNILLGVVAIYLFRRPASELDDRDWSFEIALLALCTLWFSPVVWSYHPTAVLPALSLVLGRWWMQKPGFLLTFIWLVGLAMFGVYHVRAACHMLWISFLIGGMLIKYGWWESSEKSEESTPRNSQEFHKQSTSH